ncbi:urokinase-type plasminogen activator [Aquarana catesbeiana]|uniref:urokinase-type plasminogen activator n=1 Tax=Aquarana catesbeiana TaxID=8400 RepID=UPI003CC9CB26
MKLILTLALACALISGLESTFSIKTSNSEDCVCLNGGSCLYRRTHRRPYRCACPTGYDGQHCERDMQATCYKDRGQNYRGTASRTTHNYTCMRWDSPLLKNHYFNANMKDALKLGLGKHNYCRNPEIGMRPWCYFRGPKGISTMFCQIPKCESEATTVSTTLEKIEPSCGRRQHKLYKIVGGMSSPIESQPWIAMLYQVSRRNRQQLFFQCGGSLIHPCWVVTAAHCFPDGETPEPKDYAIVLGKNNLDETNEFKEQKFLVEKIIRHKHYSDLTNALDNDIALVKIRSESGECAAMTDHVQTICLPPPDLKLEGGTKCEIAGFGKEAYDSIKYSQVLKSSTVQIIPQNVCQSEEYYGKLINNNMFCAGDPAWKVDACKGDSGGPLICNHNDQMVLYGVISWGDECAKKNKPGVYTRMTNYLSWIEENMAESPSMQANFIPK